MVEIAGKVAIVTGAGSGIGRAAALRLAREGASVVVSDINADECRATEAMIREAGGTATAYPADVSKDGDLKLLFGIAERAFGGLDILLNNAGITSGMPPWPDGDPERWNRTLEVNLWAVIRGTQLAIPMMKQRGGGAIVNTASVAGLDGFPFEPVYAATKGGVVLFTRSLAGLMQSDRISVTAICPGAVDTNIWRAAEEPMLRETITRIPFLAPDEIADAMVALIRDNAAAGKALRITAAEGRRLL